MTGPVTVNGNAYSDDGSAARDMRFGGHKLWLLPLASDIAAVGAAATASAAAAAGSAASRRMSQGRDAARALAVTARSNRWGAT